MMRFVCPVLRYEVAISTPVTTTSTTAIKHVLPGRRVAVELLADRDVRVRDGERAAGARRRRRRLRCRAFRVSLM